MMHIIGSRHVHTTTYHLSGDGLGERFPHQLKTSLIALGDRDHWSDVLRYVLLSIRYIFKDQLNGALAEFVYGATL